jgi:hypothetical protein
VCELVDRLENVQQSGSRLQLLGRVFPALVARIGHNAALDAALKALLDVHGQFLRSGRNTKTNDMGHYAEALCLIRKDLDLQRSKTSSETVCAAHILALYEVSRSVT